MLLNEFDLNGKVAVIVGDSRRWTKVFVKGLAGSGADVVAVASTFLDIEEVMEEVKRLGRRGMALETDITKREKAQRTVETIMSRFGKIDILINNAAVESVKPFSDSTEKEWQNIINNNVVAVMLWCQIVGKQMLERKAGRIINIISALSVRALPHNTIYCASMGAIHQFTKALALEWARQNISVNAIAHGWILSEENNHELMGDNLVRHIPLGRFGKPPDLTGLLVYLASNASDYITGETVFVDGGITSRG